MVSASQRNRHYPQIPPHCHTPSPKYRETLHNGHIPPPRPRSIFFASFSSFREFPLHRRPSSARILYLEVTCVNRFVLFPLSGISALPFALCPHHGKLSRRQASSSTSKPIQAFTTAPMRRSEIDMFQKGLVPPIFAPSRTSSTRPLSQVSETETEFEDDYSDVDEYSGRRSEESVSQGPLP